MIFGRMMMKYGKTVNAVDSTIYVVETKWPDRDYSSRWAVYSPSAFNDKRNPNTSRDGYGDCKGTFDRCNEDVASHESRLGNRLNHKWACGDFGDGPKFSDAKAALAYAKRIAEYGEVAAIYGDGGSEESRRKNYEGAIRSRVVEQRLASIDRVVLSV